MRKVLFTIILALLFSTTLQIKNASALSEQGCPEVFSDFRYRAVRTFYAKDLFMFTIISAVNCPKQNEPYHYNTIILSNFEALSLMPKYIDGELEKFLALEPLPENGFPGIHIRPETIGKKSIIWKRNHQSRKGPALSWITVSIYTYSEELGHTETGQLVIPIFHPAP